MITLNIAQSDWETATKYWSALSTNKNIKKEDTLKQIDFLNDKIFNNESKMNEVELTRIPSVSTMTQLMNEIESEIDAASTVITFSSVVDTDVDDTKDTTKDMLNAKENKTLKEFVSKPVMCD